MENLPLINLAYLVATVLLILGLWQMSHPRTALRGNLLGTAGMAVAVGAALFGPAAFVYIIVGVVVGSALGALLACTITMTAVPNMAALLNASAGGAAVLAAGGLLIQAQPAKLGRPETLVAMALAGILGSMAVSGSLAAYAKREGYAWLESSFPISVRRGINIILAFAVLLFSGLLLLLDPTTLLGWSLLLVLYVLLALVASLLGFLVVNSLARADLPPFLPLLTSSTGLAAAALGFALDNHVLIVAGALVGSLGMVLAQLACRTMNRSLARVLSGRAAAETDTNEPGDVYASVRSTTAEEVALLLDDARRVVVVPGFGLAAAQAQHALRDLTRLLESRGVRVEYAIHPLAGRMPGHMSIVLAEADVPYEQLKELERINPTLETADVALVVGANDVVNPAARAASTGPLAGMAVLDVAKCRAVVVLKRSLKPGFAGVSNPLFARPNTLLLYGDAQESLLDLVRAVKST